MQGQASSSGPTVIVEVEVGVGDREADAARLHETLRGLVSQGYGCILINLAQVVRLDTFMLTAILQGYISAKRLGTTVKLLHGSRRVKELLAVTKCDRLLETVEPDDAC